MTWRRRRTAVSSPPKYPGIPAAVDGASAVVWAETAASEGAGASAITPAARMGEGFAAARAGGRTNVQGRPLVFVEPGGAPSAAAVAAGMSLAGLRATSFSAGQGVASMHESLYASVGKRLPWVLHVACRAITKQAVSVHSGHDDYHAVDDTGLFQLFARNVQEVADLSLIAHRIAELSLNPGLCAQDGGLTSDAIESVRLPEPDLVREYLGDPADLIESPTPAQRLVFGDRRRRIPELFDLDYPAMLGAVQNQDAYQQGVAAQRPFYFDHLPELADRAFDEYAALTGRRYARSAGYRVEDAEYVLVGQGSVAAIAEAVADHLRATRGLRVGAVNVTMFRPFPADRLVALLDGARAVVVLERVDQPLAVDPPLLREIRAAMSQALENWRAQGRPRPHPGLGACAPDRIPDFYAGCFGLGGRDLQPADLVAAVDNMLVEGGRRRRFYLGIDFVRPATRLPKLQLWQERLLEHYPQLAELALTPGPDVDLLPGRATALRIHSVAGHGAITAARILALTATGLGGLHVKVSAKHGADRKGQPTTCSVVLAPEPIRFAGEPATVDVVLATDPDVVRHADPLAGLADEGVFLLQAEPAPEALGRALPAAVRRRVVQGGIRCFHLDAFGLAAGEAVAPERRYRMQGAAWLGALLRVLHLTGRIPRDEATVFDHVRAQAELALAEKGPDALEEHLRLARRGFAEVREIDVSALTPATADDPIPRMPAALEARAARPGVGHPGRFWEEVGYLHATGRDGIADPFAATGVIPAVSAAMRDMTGSRLEVPEFLPAKCTGCGQCWTQCPDGAIPGLVTGIDELIRAAIATAGGARPLDSLRPLVRSLADETRRLLRASAASTVGAALADAYTTVADKLGRDATRRAELDADFAAVHAVLADAPLARTALFFDGPESRERGTGGILSVTVDPEACKGCNLCVEVCPEGALRTVRQDPSAVERLRRHWAFWRALPETDDRYVDLGARGEGIDPLAALLLKKAHSRTMVGGDVACMGCGEKTVMHLVVAAISARMLPRVQAHVSRLEELIAGLDAHARSILVSDADLDAMGRPAPGTVDIPLGGDKQHHVQRIAAVLRDLRDLHWRYTEGPGGRGRASGGIANASGCSSVWASTYPYNPYPVPWVSHLAGDAPAIAIGLFEAQMRKMARGFAAVRRAELELAGEYDPARHDPELARLEWRSFTDAELALCPPILAVGGDGAMLDTGLHSLSDLLASGKPVRVVLLDTQGYSSTGGQAGGAGFPGQGAGRQGARKEPAFLAIAHRDVFVLQSSQAAPAHLLAGLLKGLDAPQPAAFVLYSPCPTEHGLGDAAGPRAARLALESRAFPLLVHDPAAGPSVAERLSLEGNPAPDRAWPEYTLTHVDADGAEQRVTLPLTIADWAATEGRFRRHFQPAPDDAADSDLVGFHEYLALGADDRVGKQPFVYSLWPDRRLRRLLVADEIVRLAEDRQHVWASLRALAGASDRARTVEFEQRLAALRAEYEAKLADLKRRYPQLVARRLAEGLLRAANGGGTVATLLSRVAPSPDAASGDVVPPVAPAPTPSAAAAPAPAPPATAVAEEDRPLVLEASIDSALCTACNECTNINKRLFAYNAKKQAYIKDVRAGSFQQLVRAAEKCPVRIIHPGTPLDPGEKDLDKWVERARPFN